MYNEIFQGGVWGGGGFRIVYGFFFFFQVSFPFSLIISPGVIKFFFLFHFTIGNWLGQVGVIGWSMDIMIQSLKGGFFFSSLLFLFSFCT